MLKEKSCFGFLFFLSIVVGIILGIIIRNGMRSDSPSLSTLPPSDSRDDNLDPEDTILVIGVDSMEGNNPRLEGAWLVTLCTECSEEDQSEDQIHIVLFTLYPLLSENITNFELREYTKPHQPIVVDPDDLESLEQIPPIALAEENWSDVIILDEVVMNTAIHLNDVNFTGPINTPSPDTFYKPWNNPDKAFQQQWRIITTLCDEPEAYGQFKTIQKIVRLYGSHLRSSLTDAGLFQLWQVVNFKPGDVLNCEIYPESGN